MLEVLTMAEEKRSIKNSKAKGESKGLGNFWEWQWVSAGKRKLRPKYYRQIKNKFYLERQKKS